MHEQEGAQVEDPRWLVLPFEGLYGNVIGIGATGSAKTSSLAYPITAQLLRIHAGDPPGRRTPIVGWTASVLDADLERCRAAGMEAVLGKPLDRDSLERLLARIVAEPAAAR